MVRLRFKGASDLIEKRQLRDEQIERCDVLQRDNDRLVAELRAMGKTTTDFRTLLGPDRRACIDRGERSTAPSSQAHVCHM